MATKRLYYGIMNIPKDATQANQTQSLKAHQVKRWGEVAVDPKLLQKYHKPALDRIKLYRDYVKVRLPQLRNTYGWSNDTDVELKDYIKREWRVKNPQKIRVPHPQHPFLQQEIDETSGAIVEYLRDLGLEDDFDEEINSYGVLHDNEPIVLSPEEMVMISEEVESELGHPIPDADKRGIIAYVLDHINSRDFTSAGVGVDEDEVPEAHIRWVNESARREADEMVEKLMRKGQPINNIEDVRNLLEKYTRKILRDYTAIDVVG